MSKVISVNILDTASIDAAVRELREYAEWIEERTRELVRRLADMGLEIARVGYQSAEYTGDNDVQVNVEQQNENTYKIIASGIAVLFIEFGSGVTYGYGHPNPTVDGKQMGPGTYPSDKGHWNDPRGWYLPGSGSVHTYGNPPSMTMYLTANELRNELVSIAREVFSS